MVFAAYWFVKHFCFWLDFYGPLDSNVHEYCRCVLGF